MKIEVLTIGDEILSGNIVDTNFAWLGEYFWTRGFHLHWHTSVGDEPEDITTSLLAAQDRSQAVIVTGGLGPTIDDITLEVAAQTFGKNLQLNEEGLADIEARFRKMGRTMSDNNRKQALMPEGTSLIKNANGTAPGCHAEFGGVHYFFLPGVPSEMKPMIEQSVLPTLNKLTGKPVVFYQRLLRCFGLPESVIDKKLSDVNLEGVDLAFRVFFPEILLKVSARGTQTDEIKKRVDDVAQEIYKRLDEVVYSEGEKLLPQVVGELLKSRGETLSVAESCTGGRLASLITDVAGSSAYFDRGVVTYSNQSKMDLLDVSQSILEKYGAVSAETAIAMAEGLRKKTNTTYALSITGIAGPDGGTEEKPVGTVHIALATAEKTIEKKLFFPTSREWFKQLVAFGALDMLRRMLQI